MAESAFTEELRKLGRGVISRDSRFAETDQRTFQRNTSETADFARQLGLDYGVGPEEQFDLDRRNMPPAAFARKYGVQKEQARTFDAVRDNLDPVALGLDRREKRETLDLAGDIAGGVTSGLGQGIAGLANLGLLAADKDVRQLSIALAEIGAIDQPVSGTSKARQAVAAGAEEFSSIFSDNASSTLKKQRSIRQQRQEAALADSQTKLDQSEGGIKDQLKRIGRDALIGTAAIEANPSAFGDITAQAVGSLAPSVAAAGGTTAIARGIINKVGAQSTKVGAVIENVSAAGAIGAVEGQGAYNQVVNEVNNTDFDTLRETSPAFNELLEAGATPSEARAALAEASGIQAQKVQTGVASAVGLVARPGFEANPFKELFTKGPSQQLLTLAAESVEEAVQSGSGELSANLGIRDNVNPDRELTENVGTAAAEGFAGGLGATSVITTPGSLSDVGKDLAGEMGSWSKRVAEVRAEQVRQKLDDESPIGERATTDNINTLDELLNQAEQLVAAEANNDGLTEEAQSQLASIANAPTWLLDTRSDEFVARTGPISEDVVDGSRTQTIRRVAAKLNDGAYNGDPVQEAAAANFIREEIERLQQYNEDIALRENASPTEQQASEITVGILNNKNFSEGFDKASQVLNAADAAGRDAPPTPREIAMNPVGVSPERITDEFVETLAPEVQGAARVVQAINSPELGDAVQEGQEPAEGRQNTRRGTRKELVFTNRKEKYGVIPSFNDLMSIALRGAINNTRRGSTITVDPQGRQVDAKDSVQRLANLVQHMQNKFEAASESYVFSRDNPGQDSRVKYETLKQSDGETFTSREDGNQIFVNANSAQSLETFAQIAEDLNTGVRAYNALLEQYPEVYQGTPFQEVAVPDFAAREQTQEANNATAPQEQTDQQTGTESSTVEEVSTDPVVDTSDRNSSDSLQPNQLSFEQLFPEGQPTTLTKALDYIDSLGSITEGQKILSRIIRGSSVFNGRPDMVVRQATEQELSQRSERQIYGWYDPVADEIVLGRPTISLFMHEAIHATTIELMNQNLTSGFNKRNKGQKLTDAEQAALDLRDMANQWMNSEPTSETMAGVQAMMRQLARDNDTAESYTGSVQAVSEFMAYGLTEAPIQRDLASREFVRPNLASRIIKFLRNLFGLKPKSTMFQDLVFNTHRVATDYQTVLSTQAQAQSVESSNVEEGPQTDAPVVEQETQAAPETTTETEPEGQVTETPEPAVEATVETVPETVEETVSEPAPVEESTAVPEALAEATPQPASVPEADPTPVAEPETVSQPLVFNTTGRDGVSRLAEAIPTINPVLRDPNGLQDLLKEKEPDLGYELSRKERAALNGLESEVVRLVSKLEQRIVDGLQSRQFNIAKKSLYDAYVDYISGNSEIDPTLSKEGKMLAYLDHESVLDGNPRLNEHLTKLAMYAAADYVINTDTGGGVHKAEDIIDILGLDKEAGQQVTTEMYQLVNFGRRATDIKEGLAKHIMNFWGAQGSPEVSETLEKGFSEAMADEIVDMLQEEAPDVDLENPAPEDSFWFQRFTGSIPGSDRTYSSVKIGNKGEALGAAQTILRDLMAPKDTDAHKYSIGEPFTFVPDTLVKDKDVLLSDEKRTAIEKQQNTQFFLSPAFQNILNSFGKETLAKILGRVDLTDDSVFYNNTHLESIKGKNKSIERGITETIKQGQALQAYADKNGVSVNDVPIHYKLEISLNGRYFFQGFNPQSDKFAREMFSPNRTTVQLDNAADMEVLYAAIGQAIDTFKVENLGLAQSAAKAQELLQSEPLKSAVQAMRDRDNPASADVLVQAMENREVEESARLLKALYVAAQIEDAQAAGETSIDIDLAMELDGKTNGPITAAIQMNTENFSPEFLATYRRGGFFIGDRFDGRNEPMDYATYNQQYEDSVDLYEVTGELQTDELLQFLQLVQKGTRTANKNDRNGVSRAMGLTLDLLNEVGDITFERNGTTVDPETGQTTKGPVIKIKRKGTKSPITQNLYGAGVESIAAGITNAIFKMIYEEISIAVQNNNGDRLQHLAAIVDELGSISVRKNNKTDQLFVQRQSNPGLMAAINNRGNSKDWYNGLRNFSFSSKIFTNVRDAIKHTYMPAFEGALEQSVGHSVKKNNDAMVEATNAQAAIYTGLVRDAVNKRLKEMRANKELITGQQLPRSEYRKILAKYRRFAPIIDTGQTAFDLTGGDVETSTDVETRRREQRKKGDPVEETFNSRTETLSGHSSDSKRDALSDPGVRVLPYNVIANADVAMETTAWNNPAYPTQSLAVHDGNEFAVTDVRAASEVMNSAVADSWMKNTIEPVVQSLESVLELESEARAAGIPLTYKKGQEEFDAFGILRGRIEELRAASRQRQAKIDALATVQFTVDGVPGAQNPYVKETGQRFDNERDLINHLNNEMDRRSAELEAEEQAKRTATFEDQAELEPKEGSALRKALNEKEYSGHEGVGTFINILEQSLELEEHKNILAQLKNSAAFQDAKDAGLKIFIHPKEDAEDMNGYYHQGDNELHLYDVTNEIAVHELIHASTVNQISSYYEAVANGETIDPELEQSIKSLESLMDDFASRDFKDGTVESNLANFINNANLFGRNPQALGEFVAWSLSNNVLIQRGKERIANDPLSQVRELGRRALQAIRRMLGFTATSAFDRVYFHSVRLMNQGTVSGSLAHKNAVYRHQLYEGINRSNNSRKMNLQKLIGSQVTAFLDRRYRGDSEAVARTKTAESLASMAEAQTLSFEALNRVEAAGFDINTSQDRHLFRALQSIFAMDLNLDKQAALEAQKVFEALTKDLSYKDFLAAQGLDVSSANTEQITRAEMMHAAVVGLPFQDINQSETFQPTVFADGTSDRLSTFLALAQTSDLFRGMLESKKFGDLQFRTSIKTGSLDQFLNTVTEKTLGSINKRVMQDVRSEDLSAATALDVLTEMLLQHDAEAATRLENTGATFLQKTNRKTKALIESGGRQAADALRESADRASTDLSAAVQNLGAGLSDLLVEDRFRANANNLTSLLNNSGVPEAIRNLWSEIRGITGDTQKVFALVKRAKNEVSKARQEFIETVPKIITNKFSDDFNNKRAGESNSEFRQRQRDNQEAMHVGYGKTDLGAAVDVLGETYVFNLFGSGEKRVAARQAAIKEIQGRVANAIKPLGLPAEVESRILKAYDAKARQLGNFMVNDDAGLNLLRNADALMNLYNENGLSISEADFKALQKAINNKRVEGARGRVLGELHRSLDVLATLHAMDRIPNRTQDRLEIISQTEREGSKYAVSYMRDLRDLENQKTDRGQALNNAYKGFTNSNARRKYSVIIASDRDHAKLRERGYTRVKAYKGPEGTFDPKARNQSYYFSAHQKLATYNQGALQTVQDTYFGVDPTTGLTIGPNTTGDMITGDAMKLLNRRMKQNKKNQYDDNLLPVFGEGGNIIGFEQVLSPDMINRLQMSNNYAESLGTWAGRIHEEKTAHGFNEALVDALYETWQALGGSDADQFAEFGFVTTEDGGRELSQDLENDPIWRESYFLMPKSVREYAHEKFGGPIMIRRDMINNALGFRSASVADFYTGKTRINEEIQQTVKDIFLGIPFLGPDMYKILTVGEEGLQQIVSEVKHVIVVKSGIILAANTLSNVIQLAGREVPLSYMGKRSKSKFAELQQYKNNEELKIRLRADMLAAKSKSAADAIANRIKSIEESERRMSIWPLLEANQFTTISEGLTDVDRALIDGKFMDWIEQKAGELPGPLSTVARYAIVSKDTALYKGLARGVQYSDFIAKAVYYDFLVEERGLSPEAALTKIDGEFINYDLNDSRTRTYLESIGMTWFMNFKLRALKIALDMAKNNPASTLLGLGVASAFGLDAGSPVTDNVAGATADGRLGYSIGPGMVEAGYNLNPWVQIFND